MEVINGYILIEPITKRGEIAEKVEKIGLVFKDQGTEGTPNQGYVRFIPKGMKTEYKIDDRVVFLEPMPNGFEHDGVGYIPVKDKQIVAVING